MIDGLKRIVALATAASLAGCNFAPAYQVPAMPVPVAYKEAGPWQVASPDAPRLAVDWWTVFGDPTLDRLEGQVATSNPTLAGALARYDQARAYLGEAKADMLPQLGVDTDLTRNRQSDHRPLRSADQPSFYSADTVQAELSYEVDLWGRVRNTVAAGRAEVQASGDDLADIRLSLEAQLAVDYMRLRGDDRQRELLSATVAAFAQADKVTRRRFQGGIASGIDTGRSGDELAEAQAQLDDVQAARALEEHAIASLVGTPASNFSLASATIDLSIPPAPAALSSTLLERRPDIAAAERRVAAANAEIGATKAAFFPAITLGGNFGVQNTGLPGLFSAPNVLWSIGPSAVLTIFDGGRRHAELAAARARWSYATAQYRSQVLAAFQQVEDNLAQLHHLGDEAQDEARAVDRAAQTERLSLHRYTKGAVDYLDVVTAQTTALRVRRTALDLDTRRLEASIGLIRALGGGWTKADRALQP